MRCFVFASIIAVQLGSYGASAQAASVAPPPNAAANSSIILVQGWWEQGQQGDRARQAYWRLTPPALERYNRLQFQINQLAAQRGQIDEQIRRSEREQQELLGFGRR
jgi:hypothetical protein